MMDQEKKAQWVAALRSGEYQQGKGVLHGIRATGHEYCCLGVLCDVAVKDGLALRVSDYPEDVGPGRALVAYNGYDDFLPREVQEWAGLDSPNPGTQEPVDVHKNGQPVKVTLSWLNDEGKSFSEIADIIERDL